MKIVLLSPYHGGSHRAWARGYERYSTNNVHPLTLPARFWKWRMHGSAVTLARKFCSLDLRPSALLATDMLDLTTFMALTRELTVAVPVVLYMHENQLTYPLPSDGTSGPMRRQHGERDLHYAFINYVSMLASDKVLFNSQYHLRSFFAELPNLLKHFPDYNETATVMRLREKSDVLPVGIDTQELSSGRLHNEPHDDPESAPLILWNQRWEYDKNPGEFFAALYVLAEEGIPFRLALCGEQYGRQPSEFAEARHRLADRLVHVGFLPRDRYVAMLWQAAITVSTAHHEFFGIGILEAIYCQTLPLLPSRLSYPELIPSPFHEQVLYDSFAALVDRLRWALTDRRAVEAVAEGLAESASRYDWSHVAAGYDRVIGQLVGGN